MLNSDSSPTKPPAAATVTLERRRPSRKKSWIIGLACSRMPMPAVTLQNSTVQSSQNCGVRIALAADTSLSVTSGFSLTSAGSKPSGCQPGGRHPDVGDAEHHDREVDDAEASRTAR